MDQLKKLREKKGDGKMRPMEQKAKMGVLEDLQRMASEAMGGKLKGMSKVTVASDDPDDLSDGLDKAKDLLGHMPEAMDDSHPDHENFEASEKPEDGDDGMSDYADADDDHGLEAHPDDAHEEGEMAEGGDDDMSDEDLDAQIAHLMKLKAMKRG